MRLLAVAVFLLRIVFLNAARILMFYYPTYSHMQGSLHVAKQLASRGHTIWNALSTNLANDTRLQAPGITIIPYQSLLNNRLDDAALEKMLESYFSQKGSPVPFDAFIDVCDGILRDTSLYEKLKNLKLDLIILDVVPIAKMLTIVAYKLDVPFIFMGAVFEPQTSRTPFVLSTFPFPLMPWTPAMDFRTRFANSLIILLYWLYDPFSSRCPVQVYAPEKPYISLDALTAKGWLWLIELEPFLYYPQATLPNVKFIGSLTASKRKSLPQVYRDFLGKAEHGVVIVSFGSNVKYLPDDLSEKLVDAFSRTKYKFIYKTIKNMTVGPDIMLTDWMPQSDLLSHPKTKLFITHCGANGQSEAFLSGVPMIGFPMFAEQHGNAERIVYKGFGLRMDLLSFTVKELVDNINSVIENKSYSMKIKKAAEITKTLRHRSPKEEAVYWIEHVLQYGGDHLRSYCQDMPLYQYLNLDVIGLLLLLLHLCLYLIWKLLSLCCRKIILRSPRPKDKKD